VLQRASQHAVHPSVGRLFATMINLTRSARWEALGWGGKLGEEERREGGLILPPRLGKSVTLCPRSVDLYSLSVR